jgi:hypothetical protein
MRTRSAVVFSTALLTGLTLVLPLSAAQGAAPRPATDVQARRASTVTLATGEHLRLTGKKGKERVLVQPAAKSGPGRAVLTQRLGGRTYVIPAVAEPYLGRILDKNLFDVTGLAAALKKNGRLPVRISYRGSAPAAPGITITSKSGGTARGYLTPKSSPAFGRALTAQWTADAKAGFPKRKTLFSGLTKISADLPAAGTVTPTFPMYTLVIKAIGVDGKPQPEGFIGLINVDDGRKYASFAFVENGEARVSVPKGTYSAAGDDFTYDEAAETSSFSFASINEFKVTGAGKTLTLDYRKATLEPSAVVPKPAAVSSSSFEWNRADAKDHSSLGLGYSLGEGSRLFVEPSAKAKVGRLGTVFNWSLTEPVAAPSYSYTVAAKDDQIPAKPNYSFTDAQLATVNAAYYGEGVARTAGFLRYPVFGDGGGGGAFERVARGTRRTEYVGAVGGKPRWYDSALLNYDSFEDPGFIDGPSHAFPAGSTTALNWLKGPLGAAIPVQPGGGYCFGCRYGNTLSVGLLPFTDSYLTHYGRMFGAEDGLPVARFRFYRNGKLVSDQDDMLGGAFGVSRAKATYRAVLEVDRRLQDPTQSTRTKTELTFVSARNAGKKLPSSWYCDGDACRVLPIVQARLSLPLSLDGTLPAGKSTVTVSVAQVQAAAKSPVTSAGLEVRPSGSGWSTVKLTSIGGGKYRGVVDNTEFAGVNVDVRFSGADKAGSKFTQTVVRAYTVAGS